MTLGRMARRVPKSMLHSWTYAPRRSAAIRRDLVKYATATDHGDLLQGTCRLATFPEPTLILWSRADTVMPHDHAEQLARAMPDARLETFESGSVLLQLDRPRSVTEYLLRFLLGTAYPRDRDLP